MSSYNRVVIVGNLTRDPELKSPAGGMPVADIGLACNEVFKNAEGARVSRPCFVDMVAWGKLAETCARYLAKGRLVLVEGRLQFDQWEDKDGRKRSKLRVRADRVEFLPSGGSRGEHGPGDREPDVAVTTGKESEMPF